MVVPAGDVSRTTELTEQVPDTAPQDACEHHTILVIEDDAAIRELLAEALADEGYTVAQAVHGQAALDYLQVHPRPCVMLLDLYMPVMDGWQFHRAQLRDPRLADIPVVVMSAVANTVAPLAWFRAEGYLTKPFTIDEVLAYLTPRCSRSTRAEGGADGDTARRA